MYGSAEPGACELEARLFTRYLLDREPPAALIGRYREAARTLFAAGATPAEQSVVAFVRRHPWSLPFLDAAAGLLRADSLLRRRILLMAAILETSTTFAEDLLSRPVGRLRLLGVLAAAGARSVAALAVGIPLLRLVERAHR